MNIIPGITIVAMSKRSDATTDAQLATAGDVAGRVGLGAAGVLGINRFLGSSLGLNTHSHVTSAENARKIMSGGGFLDPGMGGTLGGASGAIGSAGYIGKSKGYVHLSGAHPDLIDGAIRGAGKRMAARTGAAGFGQLSRLMYRGVHSLSPEQRKRFAAGFNPGPKDVAGILLGGVRESVLPSKTRTVYHSTTTDDVRRNFTPDPDDLAIRSTSPVKVHKSRLRSVLAGAKKHGVRGMLRGVASNPLKAGIGAAGVAGGGYLVHRALRGVPDNLRSALAQLPAGVTVE